MKANVRKLSADFEQHCEGGVPALRGQLRIDSVHENVAVSDAMISGSSASIVIALSKPQLATETVVFKTADGSATAVQDYLPLTPTASFPPGETKRVVKMKLRETARPGTSISAKIKPARLPAWIARGYARLQ